MTLRHRLAVALSVVALIVVGSIVGVLVVLRSSLHAELDKQLLALTRERIDSSDQSSEDAASGTPTQLADECIRDPAAGEVSSAACSGSDGLPRLDADVVEAHATDPSAPFEPFDVEADGDHYRVTAVKAADGRMAVTSVSTAHIDAVFRRVAAGSAVAGLGVLAAMALVAWWVQRLGLRPIRNVAAAADSIASGDATARVDPPLPGTEAGDLARAFNVMAERRQVAEDRLRRFVADASHELRTPLATVAGVHELFRSGSLAGADLNEAMGRAGSEARRMTSLVEDLIELTQLDHGRPVDEDEVDLAVLVRDAAVDAGIVQPERPITIEAADGAMVPGDESRLRQVVGNLVNNALVHTRPSTPLHLAVYPGDDAHVVEVRDEGPGLTAVHAAHVFDRFYRVAPGRSRRAGGTGLGLSIVQSIVAAHGGHVSVTAAPGRGCSFRVVLPVRPALPDGFQGTSSVASEGGDVCLSRSSHVTQSQDQPR